MKKTSQVLGSFMTVPLIRSADGRSAIGQGLGNVNAFDCLGAIKIGERAGYF